MLADNQIRFNYYILSRRNELPQRVPTRCAKVRTIEALLLQHASDICVNEVVWIYVAPPVRILGVRFGRVKRRASRIVEALAIDHRNGCSAIEPWHLASFCRMTQGLGIR